MSVLGSISVVGGSVKQGQDEANQKGASNESFARTRFLFFGGERGSKFSESSCCVRVSFYVGALWEC